MSYPAKLQCFCLLQAWAFFSSLCCVGGMEFAFSEDALRLVETEQSLSVFRRDQLVLTYNKMSPPVPSGIDSVYQRSGFLHPVKTPAGETVTATFPKDHPHQHGIFSAWVKTTYDNEAIDFWNLAGNTGDVRHSRVLSKFEGPSKVGFEVELLHRRKSKVPLDILRERWKVVVQQFVVKPTDEAYACFDLETYQENIAPLPLTIEKYHYGGLGFRGPVEWLLPSDSGANEKTDGVDDGKRLVGSRFLTSNHHARIEGNNTHVKWVVLTRGTEGTSAASPVSIAALCHPDNPSGEQAVRLHPTKPYFAYSPCIDGSFQIAKGAPYVARYRYLLTDKAADPDWLQQKWSEWAAEKPSE